MWRDEVRAFSTATGPPTWASMIGGLHQEGHPALWYILLWAGFAITHSNLVLPVLALAVGIAAAYLLLRYSPFPFWLRLLTVFGAFVGYEYSVVARNYGLGVLLLIAACILFRTREKHAIPLGFVLALTANTSVHATAASLLILFVWVLDAIDADKRTALLRVAPLAGIAIAVSGAVLAVVTGNPSPDMSYALLYRQVDSGAVLGALAADPGLALKGVYIAGLWHSDIAAAGELPWAIVGVASATASRIIVDLCLLCLGWGLWPSRRHFIAMIVAVLGFEILFSAIYPAAIRHQGILTFLLVAICWIAIESWKQNRSEWFAHRVALGLLPLMAVQAFALPVIARRLVLHPASSSKALAGVIQATPRLSNAILMSEPDYLMEPLPYYVKNPVYMPRQREYNNRVYFDSGMRRQATISLGSLLASADSIGCATQRPVLLSIGTRGFRTNPGGMVPGAYHGSVFTWSAGDKAKLTTSARLLGDFNRATTDENYQVFEITPRPAAECASEPKVSHDGAL